ncbi:hypothetical protein [Gynurincola endophyticus]|uniref:hypothetical protein n=1 Tax=Gynurincola endophyticus TaxID=2479004 RepID=UPI000F8DF03B|nr:hypothetical protein [Gynurincola endophyticus]
MKLKLFFLIAFLLSFCSVMLAQPTNRYGDSATLRRASMEASAIAGDLQLSQDQQKSLEKVLDTFYFRMQLLNEKFADSKSAATKKRDEMRRVYVEREKRIESVLNEVQWNRYLSGMNERRYRLLADTALSRSIGTSIIHQ